MKAKEVVIKYWKAMETNDFHHAATFLSEDYECRWPQSGETILGRANIAAINSEYPSEGKWTFIVNSIVAEDDQVVTDVSLSDGTTSVRAITFHQVKNGLIHRQVEYWPEEYDPPEWRKRYVKID